MATRVEPATLSQLLWAVKNGDLEKVQELIESQNALKDRHFVLNKEVEGRKYVHYACDYDQIDVLKYLIENGANADDEDQYGIRPIQTAIWEDNIEIVQYLLNIGVPRSGLYHLADSDEMRTVLKPRNKQEEEEDRLAELADKQKEENKRK